ncbi:MAG: DUF5693 family protein [Armatimonadaceae bacterium]
MRTVRSVFWAAVWLGLVAALFNAAARWQVEARNRQVEITVDYADVRALAMAERISEAEALRELKRAGVVSVAVPEDTLAALEEARKLTILPLPEQDTQATPEIGEGFSVRVPEASAVSMAQRIEEALGIKTGAVPLRVRGEGSNLLTVPTEYATVRGIGLGVSEETIRLVQDAELAVVGRVSNFAGVRSAGIVWELNRLKRQGIQTVLFLGDEILGYKGYITDDPEKPKDRSTAGALRDSDLWVGIIEFSKQKGEAALARAGADRAVRVHTITGAEMLSANVPTNVQRFGLAARERNIRLLYVRLFLDEKNPLEFNTRYLKRLVSELKQGGLQPGIAHGYLQLSAPLWTRALIGLGIAGVWLLLLDSVTGIFSLTGKSGLSGMARLVGGGSAMVLVLLPLAGETGAKLAALAAACIYPSLALLYRDVLDFDRTASAVRAATGRFLLICGITGLGIAAVVGLLTDRLFLIKADAFIGIKGAQLIPLLLATLVYALTLRATATRSFVEALCDTGERLKRLSAQPVLLWQVAVTLAAGVVLALLVLRSGNDPGVGVSPIELKIRALLDQLLYARPRFKEFLIGHPALVLSLILAAIGQRRWALVLLPVGIIGQVSLLNTFCHLHTPLLVSLWRALLGIAIGLVFGLAAYLVLVKRWVKPAAATDETTKEDR